MSANPKEFLSQTAKINQTAIESFPNSKKIYIAGSRPDINVPMREITLSDTHTSTGVEKNAALTVYDTSGPYTDPDVTIDIRKGLADIRSPWIESRNDTEILTTQTSEYGQSHANDPSLDHLRFEGHKRQPLRARTGANVSQMHYAKKGIVTPEMEYVAIRENLRLEMYQEQLAEQHHGNSFGASTS